MIKSVLTKDEVLRRFKEKKLELLSDYVKCSQKVNVKCFCGKIFEAIPNQIFTGNTKSCGCYRDSLPKTRIKDITGLKFGNLTAIKITTSKSNSGPVWLFKCDCGKEKEIASTYVTRNVRPILSCGCLKNRHSSRWTGCGEISGAYWKCVKRNAETRKISFDVNIEDAWNIFIKQNRKCVLTGLEINFIRMYNHKEKDTEQTASLDRIDSLKGYTKDNIQWVHKKVNKMKMDMNTEELIKWCGLVSRYKESL